MSEGQTKGPYEAFVDGLMKAVAAAVAPLLAFFAGRKSVEEELLKEEVKNAEKQLELNLEHGRRSNDPAERQRVRERYKDRG